MHNLSPVLRVLGTLVIFAAITMPLHATPSLVLTTPPNYNGLYNIFEGNTLDFTYLFTNDTDATINVTEDGMRWGYVSGDTSDGIFPINFLGDTCLSFAVGPGGTCTFTVQLVTDAPDVGPILDGLNFVQGDVLTDVGEFDSRSVNVYVSDVPEPGTFLLLGSSVAGFANVLRRKLIL